MSEETMLTIKTKLDTKGLDDLETSVSRSLDDISRDVDAFNKSTRVSPDTKEFKKKIEEASKLLEELTAKREIFIAKPKTEAVQKELDKLDDIIRQTTRTREIFIELDERELARTEEIISSVEEHLDSLEEPHAIPVEVDVDTEKVEDAKESTEELNAGLDEVKKTRRISIDASELDGAALDALSNLVGGLDDVAKSATKAMANVAGVSQKTASAMTKSIQSLSGLSAVVAGPLALALAAAASGVVSYVASTNTANMTTDKYSKTIDDLRKKYDELSLSTKDAGTRTQEFAEIQQRVIAAKVAEITGELQKLEKSVADAAASALATTWIADGFLGIAEAVEYTTEKGKDYRAQIEKIIADQKAGTISAESAALALREIEIRLNELQDKDGGIPKKSYDMDNLRRAILALLPAYDALAEKNEELKKFAEATEQQIAAAFKRTTEGTRAALQESIALAKKWVAESSTLPAAAQEQAKAVLAKAQKDLDDFDKRQADSQKKQGDKFKKTEEDKIAALNDRYAAQQIIAEATVLNQTDLSNTLADIEKAYYAELERLTREDVTNKVASGKKITDAQIAELDRLAEKNKEIAEYAATDELAAIQAKYAARETIARATIADEKQLEQELLAIKKASLQEQLTELKRVAEESIQETGRVEQEVLASIARIEAALNKLAGGSGAGDSDGVAQKVSQQIAQWGGLLNDMASSLGSFMDAQYNARIQSLDASLDRELRMLETAFEQQNALYEEQLKQYEDLEKRRTEIQEEYNDARESLNWKAQEHVTEDEYLAIMAQMAQEEEKYNESMMRLDEDTLKRDEIRLQQELAEQEYLARKEQTEKEYAIKRAQMERKQAQAQQATAIFSAVIFTAVGIARAFAEHMWPLSIAVAAIVAAAGAVQIAAIASRPLPSIPSYHIGGVIGGGNIQDYGHLPGPDNPHDKTLFWGEEGEYVLNKRESGFYQALRNSGMNLEELTRIRGAETQRLIVQMRSEAAIPQSTAVVAPVTHNTQQVTYQVKDRLTVSEARRLQDKANRAFLRSLA